MSDDYTKLNEEARTIGVVGGSSEDARRVLFALADAVEALLYLLGEANTDLAEAYTSVDSAKAERDALQAQLDAALSCLSATEPGNPFMYDPSEDGSVDESNRDEVVEAAVSVGWNAGAFALGERIRSAVRLAAETPVEGEQA